MRRLYILLFVGLLAGYLALNYNLPTDPETLERYSLTQASARILRVSILLPITFVYLAAFYGFYRFKTYSLKIIDSKEGPFFNNIANGLMAIVFSLPISSMASSLVSYARHAYPDIYPIAKASQSYLILIFWIVGVLLVAKGAEGLVSTLRKSKEKNFSYLGLMVPIVLASVLSWLMTAFGPGPSSNGKFILPDWVQISTIAIPYVFVWCVGIRSAVLLYRYKNRVKGAVYKRAFDGLAKGFGVIVLISVIVQFISVLSEQITQLDLSPLLGILYSLVILYAVGYGLIAKGAGRLKQIEEV